MNGEVDMNFGFVVPQDPTLLEACPGRLSSFNVNIYRFYIYSKQKLDITNLKNKKIGAPTGGSYLFNFQTDVGQCFECLYKKAAKGRIDGLIGIDGVSDHIIKNTT